MAAPSDVTGPLIPIGSVRRRERVTVRGRVRAVTYMPAASHPELVVRVSDETGSLLLVFVGRTDVKGIVAGRSIIAAGMTAERDGVCAIHNPSYELQSEEAP